MEVMYGKGEPNGITREIQIESPDSESLLADFLSEVLFISEVDGLVFSRADVTIPGLRTCLRFFTANLLTGNGIPGERKSRESRIPALRS